ncbi:hypothetical protein [Zooshikella sp. RANM57]|uniref:hypothetical protein n=1 Tax=Zooshikella sp. RANM57 TaxID=3425863 RepID=UPI003D6E35E7
MSNIIFFHGDKGGVGKSFAANLFIDFQVNLKQAKPIVIDADSRNPDVARVWHKLVDVIPVNLHRHEGWMDLMDIMADNPKLDLIVSLPAGVGGVIRREAATFKEALRTLKRQFILYWVMNRLKDSIILLKEAQQDLGDITYKKAIIKNGFYGDEDKFYRWENSQTRQEFLNTGGAEIFLPELHERVTDKIHNLPFSHAISNSDLKFSEKNELQRWLAHAHKIINI